MRADRMGDRRHSVPMRVGAPRSATPSSGPRGKDPATTGEGITRTLTRPSLRWPRCLKVGVNWRAALETVSQSRTVLRTLKEAADATKQSGVPLRFCVLRDRLMNWSKDGNVPPPRVIGLRFRALRGRVINGRVLYGVPDRNGVTRWKVAAPPGPRSVGYAGYCGVSPTSYAGEMGKTKKPLAHRAKYLGVRNREDWRGGDTPQYPAHPAGAPSGRIRASA